MKTKDNFSELIRAAALHSELRASGAELQADSQELSVNTADGARAVPAYPAGGLRTLPTYHADGLPTLPADFERRVMIEVARRAIERSRRRARRGMVASLSGLAMLLAACVGAVVVWFPALMPAFTRMSWLEDLRITALGRTIYDAVAGAFGAGTGVGESVADAGGGAALPLFEQWGGLVLLVLLIGGAAGFIYYLNNLFNSDYVPD